MASVNKVILVAISAATRDALQPRWPITNIRCHHRHLEGQGVGEKQERTECTASCSSAAWLRSRRIPEEGSQVYIEAACVRASGPTRGQERYTRKSSPTACRCWAAARARAIRAARAAGRAQRSQAARGQEAAAVSDMDDDIRSDRYLKALQRTVARIAWRSGPTAVLAHGSSVSGLDRVPASIRLMHASSRCCHSDLVHVGRIVIRHRNARNLYSYQRVEVCCAFYLTRVAYVGCIERRI